MDRDKPTKRWVNIEVLGALLPPGISYDHWEGWGTWLQIEVAPGWTAAYRVTFQGDGPRRRTRIHELRIVPTSTALGRSFQPQFNYAAWESSRQAPFSFEAIRRRLTMRAVSDALTAVRTEVADLDTDDAWWIDFMTPSAAVETPRRGPGRPRRPLEFYAEFAQRYHQVENLRRREAGDSTREVLAKEYKVPVTTIGKWIRVARQQKLLTPVVRGQRGGVATPRAAQVLTKAKASK